MSAIPLDHPAGRVVAEWADRDLPSERTSVLKLWNYDDAPAELVAYSREHPADQWSPPRELAVGITATAAQAIADELALDRYLVRLTAAELRELEARGGRCV